MELENNITAEKQLEDTISKYMKEYGFPREYITDPQTYFKDKTITTNAFVMSHKTASMLDKNWLMSRLKPEVLAPSEIAYIKKTYNTLTSDKESTNKQVAIKEEMARAKKTKMEITKATSIYDVKKKLSCGAKAVFATGAILSLIYFIANGGLYDISHLPSQVGREMIDKIPLSSFDAFKSIALSGAGGAMAYYMNHQQLKNKNNYIESKHSKALVDWYIKFLNTELNDSKSIEENRKKIIDNQFEV